MPPSNTAWRARGDYLIQLGLFQNYDNVTRILTKLKRRDIKTIAEDSVLTAMAISDCTLGHTPVKATQGLLQDWSTRPLVLEPPP